MKLLLLLASVLSIAFAADDKPTTPVTADTTTTPRPPVTTIPPIHLAKQPDKPKVFHHESHLKQDSRVNQSLDSQETSVESGEYRPLSGEEVQHLLLRVVEENIDKDKDDLVTVEELRDWLRILQEKVIQDNVNRQWDYYNPQSEDVLSWDAYYPEQKQVVSWKRYLNYTYPDEALREDAPETDEIKEIKDLIRRAERRWKNADVDGDGSLSKAEFRDFIHPEESQRAGGVAVQEALEDMDINKNDQVSLEEYMTHLHRVSGEEKEDPQWAAAQQGHFANFLDKDKDGSLNAAEMREWVVPTYDRSEAEAWRLMSIADQDQDTKLTRKDIEDYHEYFLSLLPPEYWVQEDPTESSRHDEF